MFWVIPWVLVWSLTKIFIWRNQILKFSCLLEAFRVQGSSNLSEWCTKLSITENILCENWERYTYCWVGTLSKSEISFLEVGWCVLARVLRWGKGRRDTAAIRKPLWLFQIWKEEKWRGCYGEDSSSTASPKQPPSHSSSHTWLRLQKQVHIIYTVWQFGTTRWPQL